MNFAFHHILKRKTINRRKLCRLKLKYYKYKGGSVQPGNINFIRSDRRVDLAVLRDHPVPLGLGVEHLQYPGLFPEGVPGRRSPGSQGATEEISNGLNREEGVNIWLAPGYYLNIVTAIHYDIVTTFTSQDMITS